MCNLQHRKIRNMKKQGDMTPAKCHNSSITELKDIEMIKMPNN
jgi:hypothetical protein